MTLNIPDLPDLQASTYTLQHLNSDNCVIDEKWFHTDENMEKYIDDEILPLWEQGDSIICNGSKRNCFDDYWKHSM
tara:strand:- start:47 stop:274 length:228 start_codon:yes stop_codon:yes gene_type:complete